MALKSLPPPCFLHTIRTKVGVLIFTSLSQSNYILQYSAIAGIHFVSTRCVTPYNIVHEGKRRSPFIHWLDSPSPIVDAPRLAILRYTLQGWIRVSSSTCCCVVAVSLRPSVAGWWVWRLVNMVFTLIVSILFSHVIIMVGCF